VSTRIRTLVAATAAVVAVTLLAGCSLLPGSTPAKAPAKTKGAAKGTKATPQPKPAAVEASATPALRKVVAVSQDIDGIQLRQLVDQGALLIDVRPRHDFDREHIKGAVSIPMPRFAELAKKWSQVRPIVVYDQTGAEGQTAQTWLEKQGFMAVFHLYRGLDGYDDTLVGKAPTPIPPKRPVLYYFYDPACTYCKTSDKVVDQLRDELPGEFEYHAYNVALVDGRSQFLEFGFTLTPTLRLIDERGHAETYEGITELTTMRAHLRRAVDAYKKATQS
jgi:rhodanese-related sulfurtransferase